MYHANLSLKGLMLFLVMALTDAMHTQLCQVGGLTFDYCQWNE
jgi:hypothetical protein